MDGGEDEYALEARGSGGSLVAEGEAQNPGGAEGGKVAGTGAGAVEGETGVRRDIGPLVDSEREAGSGGGEIFEAGSVGVPGEMPRAAGGNREELREQFENFRLAAGEFEAQGVRRLSDEDAGLAGGGPGEGAADGGEGEIGIFEGDAGGGVKGRGVDKAAPEGVVPDRGGVEGTVGGEEGFVETQDGVGVLGEGGVSYGKGVRPEGESGVKAAGGGKPAEVGDEGGGAVRDESADAHGVGILAPRQIENGRRIEAHGLEGLWLDHAEAALEHGAELGVLPGAEVEIGQRPGGLEEVADGGGAFEGGLGGGIVSAEFGTQTEGHEGFGVGRVQGNGSMEGLIDGGGRIGGDSEED